MKKKIDIGKEKLTRNIRLNITPDSVNEDLRTFTAIFTTDTAIEYSGWFGRFFEQLRIDAESVDVGRIDMGMPFLKNHSNDIDSVIGSVQNSEIVLENGVTQLIGNIQISKSEDPEEDKRFMRYFNRIKSGELKNISIGYRVHDWELKEIVNDDSPETYIGTRWELLEVSLVAVPADKFAQIKSFGDYVAKMKGMNHNKMNKPPIEEDGMSKETKIEKKPDNVVDEKALTEQERQRCLQISNICKSFDVDEKKFMEDGSTVDEVRKVILDKLKQEKSEKINDNPKPKLDVEVKESGEKVKCKDFSEFVMHKIGRRKALEDSNEFKAGTPFIEAVKKFENAPWENKRDILRRTVFSGSLGNLITDSLNNELRMAYMERPHNYANLVRTRTFDVLQPVKVTVVDSSLIPNDMQEGEEYEYGTIVDSQDTFEIIKRGKGLAISEESFLKDNLDGLSTIIRKFGYGMRFREAELVFKLLTSSTATVEGKTIFHADHKNLLTAATKGITIGNITDAKVLMALQKDLAGDLIRIMPRHIITAEALRASAATFLRNTFVPTEFQNQTQVHNDGLRSVISDPILDTEFSKPKEEWFLTGDVSEVEIIQRAVLSDYPTPTVVSRYIQEKDVMAWLTKFFVGFAVADYRGLVKVN